jgi:hypothetical protein
MYSTTFQPTPEDLLAAYRLNFHINLRSKRVLRAYTGGGAALAIAAALAAWTWGLSSVLLAGAGGLAYWIIMLSAILASVYYRLPRQIRRVFEQQKALHDSTTVEWSDTGISFRSTRGHSNFAWQDFIKVVKGRDVVILRQSDALMNFIPVRALSPQQLESIAARA